MGKDSVALFRFHTVHRELYSGKGEPHGLLRRHLAIQAIFDGLQECGGRAAELSESGGRHFEAPSNVLHVLLGRDRKEIEVGLGTVVAHRPENLTESGPIRVLRRGTHASIGLDGPLGSLESDACVFWAFGGILWHAGSDAKIARLALFKLLRPD